MKPLRWWWIGLILVLFVLWRWLPRGEAPALGVNGDQLTPCPDSPNAVSSQATDPRHAIAPLVMTGDPSSALQRCRDVILEERGIRLVEEGTNYLRFEAVTRWWRFVDDVECLASPTNRLVHVRSASRIGRSDLGTNRRRIERIRDRLARK